MAGLVVVVVVVAGLVVSMLAGGSSGAGPRPKAATPGRLAPVDVHTRPAASPSARAGSRPAPAHGSSTAGAAGTAGHVDAGARPGGAAKSPLVDAAAPSQPTGLNPQSLRSIVVKLPKPPAHGGPGLTYSQPYYMGASILGDLGSAAWNITHRDADGKLRTWGSGLYVSSTPRNAVAALRHSPAVPYFCPHGAVPLPGFDRAGTVSTAVVCPDAHAPGAWWTVALRADRLTYLVIATSDSSRDETVATGRAVFDSLTAMSARINVGLGVFKKLPEPS